MLYKLKSVREFTADVPGCGSRVQMHKFWSFFSMHRSAAHPCFSLQCNLDRQGQTAGGHQKRWMGEGWNI